MPHHGSGPIPAQVMIVGEAWGEYEEARGEPFSGREGEELNRMLQEAGLLRSACFVTSLVNRRPPNSDIAAWVSEKKSPPDATFQRLHDIWAAPQVVLGYQQLQAEIELVQPRVIITCGNWAMWALTGKKGITAWRGSVLKGPRDIKVIATLNPRSVMSVWSWRGAMVNDLRRAKRHLEEPGWNPPVWEFQIRPDFFQTIAALMQLQTLADQQSIWLDLDLETSTGHLACCGISWSTTEAICIPFMTKDNKEGYWLPEQEGEIVWHLYKLFTHKNVNVRWQNGLYDAQYIYKHWHFIPRGAQDTMISQHAMFSDLPKSLAYQASLYAKWYVYWKDEGKNIQMGGSEEEHWRYNCQDCIYTREVGEAELSMIGQFSKTSWPAAERVHTFQQAMFYPVLKAMMRGVGVDKKQRDKLALEVQEQITHREDFLQHVLGHNLNTASPLQMKTLFYEDLGQPPIKTRPTKYKPATVTCNDEALQKIAAREPLLKPIINCISDIRTFDLFLSNFILARLDEDGRMRCSYNIGGSASGKSAPKTYRLSSSKSAFGSGTNLQTIPSEKSKSVGKAAARGHVAMLGDPYTFPNLRSMFQPDLGFTFFDMDLDRADLQVVVWETDDQMLKAALRLGTDIHLLNAFVIDGTEPPPLEELVESHPRYDDHKGPMKHKREFAKVFCHACVTGDHEVLTPQGWKAIETLSGEEQIAIWSITDEKIIFEKPFEWHRGFTQPGEDLIEFSGQAYNQLVTLNHKLPFKYDDGGYKVEEARKVIQRSVVRLPKSGFYSGTIDTKCARLIAAFVADGSLDKHGNVTFHFHKERKKERLRTLLEGYTYSEYGNRFYIPQREAKVFSAQGKLFGEWLLQLTGENLDEILDESQYWDGSVSETGGVSVSSVNREHLEWLRTIAHLRGKASQYQGTQVSSFGSTVHRISLNKRPMATLNSMTTRLHTQTDCTPVYCPRTSTGFFMVRRAGKISVTGNTNYVGSPRTIAGHLGRSVAEIERAQKIWFGAHPGIKKWHDSISQQISKHRFVENKFGYRWYIFDRLDALLPEAVAWIPQSTVSIVINKIWMNLFQNRQEAEWSFDIDFLRGRLAAGDPCEVLLQVHDSLAGQFPTHKKEACVARMLELSKIVIPYDDPLIIPTGVNCSEENWGAC